LYIYQHLKLQLEHVAAAPAHIRGAQTAKQQLQAHEASNGGKAGRLRGAYLNCKSARFEMQIAETIRQNAVNNFRLPLDIYVSSR
jgi:hypothetical protein